MQYAETKGDDFCVTWLPDGKSFIIRDMDTFTKEVVPKYFKATKFSSFTRKLYRWGFRQINRGIGHDDPVIFGNEYFQKDHPELMTKMKSTTAAATRKAEEMAQRNTTVLAPFAHGGTGVKRTVEEMMGPIELQQQYLLSEILARKKGRFPNDSQQQLLQQQQQQQQQQDLLSPTPLFSANALQSQAQQAPLLTPQFGAAASTSLSLQNMMRPHLNLGNVGGGNLNTAGFDQSQLGGNGVSKGFGSSFMNTSGQNDSLLSQFLSNNSNNNHNVGNSGLPSGSLGSRVPPLSSSFPQNSTTADIVNAAIEALRNG